MAEDDGINGQPDLLEDDHHRSLPIAYEFKEGNDNGGKLEILKKAFSKMPN